MNQIIQVSRPGQHLFDRSPPGPSARFPNLSFHVVDQAMQGIHYAAMKSLSQSQMLPKETIAAHERLTEKTPHVDLHFDARTQEFVQSCTCGMEQRIFFPGSLDEDGNWTDTKPGIITEILPAWDAFRVDHIFCTEASTPRIGT